VSVWGLGALLSKGALMFLAFLCGIFVFGAFICRSVHTSFLHSLLFHLFPSRRPRARICSRRHRQRTDYYQHQRNLLHRHRHRL